MEIVRLRLSQAYEIDDHDDEDFCMRRMTSLAEEWAQVWADQASINMGPEFHTFALSAV